MLCRKTAFPLGKLWTAVLTRFVSINGGFYLSHQHADQLTNIIKCFCRDRASLAVKLEELGNEKFLFEDARARHCRGLRSFVWLCQPVGSENVSELREWWFHNLPNWDCCPTFCCTFFSFVFALTVICKFSWNELAICLKVNSLRGQLFLRWKLFRMSEETIISIRASWKSIALDVRNRYVTIIEKNCVFCAFPVHNLKIVDFRRKVEDKIVPLSNWT